MGGTNIHTTNSAHRPFMLHLLLMALLPWDAHFATSPHMTALHAVALDPLINRLLTTHRLCASCLSAHRCLPYATTATATTTAARDRSVPLRIERFESWVGYGLEYSCIIGLRWTDRSEGTGHAGLIYWWASHMRDEREYGCSVLPDVETTSGTK